MSDKDWLMLAGGLYALRVFMLASKVAEQTKTQLTAGNIVNTALRPDLVVGSLFV